jgi:hypothetical protein
MGGAALQFRNLGHENLVLIAPVNGDSVLVHSGLPNLCFWSMARTCLT